MARATLESVARHAAVSRQTVSNVLNAPHLVRPETLARVQAAIHELGYRPHSAARTLRTRRSRLVATRIEPPRDGVNGFVLDRFLHALTHHAQHGGYRLLLFTAEDDAGEIETYSHLLDDHDLDALVLTGTHVGDARTSWLSRREVPFVTFGRPWGETRVRHGWVDVDGAAGTRAATEHLVSAGHRRIAYLGWPAGSGVGDDRRSGWATACAAAGLTTALEVVVEDGVDSGRAATGELLDGADPPTAVVCVSDSLALGAWSEVMARGLRPGGPPHGDVAVIGFDDSPAAAVVGLSSVAQPLDDVATACLRMLHDVLGARTPHPGPPDPVLLAPQLVLRGSG